MNSHESTAKYETPDPAKPALAGFIGVSIGGAGGDLKSGRTDISGFTPAPSRIDGAVPGEPAINQH
jgi:hypothetical protein